RRDLQLEDAEGVDCLPNSTIFKQLTLMRSKITAWNEFSSTMASAIIYEAIYKELDDSLVRAATTASSLEAEHDSGNIAKTRSKATPNESSSLGTTSGGGPMRQETMGDTIAQTRFENVSKHSNEPLLARGNTLQSGEDSLKLNELMELCTNLQTRVLDLEKTKTTQAEEIVSLKRRLKKLEQRKRSRTHGFKRLYKVGITARVESSRDEEILGEDASQQGKINDRNPGMPHCNSFYWIDLKLPNEWYKSQLQELYLTLNQEQRVHFLGQLSAQERLEILQDEFEVYQNEMETEIEAMVY
ncbi:hypothetical protein Tco_1059449, partial [Tanacetum coccineum]